MQAWNYIKRKHSMEKNPFIKTYWIRHTFEVEHDSLNKKQKYITLPYHQLAENLVLFFSFYARRKQGYERICN